MRFLYSLIQFLPLTLFILTARYYGSTVSAWAWAFQVGAIAAVVQLAILLPFLKTRLNRLIGGINLFLIIGGLGFFFNINFILNFMGQLRESGVILSVGIVCILATLFTHRGVFESSASRNNLEKRYSCYFILAVAIAFIWSYLNQGNTLFAGIIPLVSLVFLKNILQNQLI